ncbi:MAG: stage II sporulation protein R, partial [Bacillota bacterium]
AEARELVLARQGEVRRAAQEVVRRAGKDYGVKVEVGRFVFPTKVYGDTALPAGKYDALRVSLGAAEGQNWWCVLFPPLCLVDAAGGVAVASPGFEDALVDVETNGAGQVGERRFGGRERQGTQPPMEVRYALVEWLKRQPLTPRLEAWLKARGWAVTPDAWRAAPPAPSPVAPHPGDRSEETPER